MMQEKKDLLLKDLCARLPYHTIVKYRNADVDLTQYVRSVKLTECKPYLRPMSSMTEDEINEYENFITNEKDDQIRFCNELIFYNRHHFDYRGLISMGLALEAPEGMYN